MAKLSIGQILRGLGVVVRGYMFGFFYGLRARNCDVCVISPGGVATTFFMEYLADRVRVNNPYDRDYLKHVACPPFFRGRKKYVYIYGDPQSIVLSLARRGYLNYQIHKNGTLLTDRSIETYDEYLESGRDLLRLSSDLAAWKRAESGSDQIMTLHFEDLWARKNEWGAFLGLSAQDLEAFPERQPRNTESIELTAEQQAAFDKIYPAEEGD
ncbi:hypothetical protein [Coraliomargarita akajimensis]|uniref:Uncharacterized protein n=1 Tax=Coraliomargarita akajimensis (strain DSM 45221 / IAM 15411 / JCM 23193 / KCTC 12865 / 04OKA010-24) TaxID=583355 RepID=D5EKV2_CORAD|nr:hypothetical protein [Coraliomargarita akajimensis]ADE55009.1 hypothetical protein Caka_1991 [Coraliomargarita akajimensis DSM 45221]